MCIEIPTRDRDFGDGVGVGRCNACLCGTSGVATNWQDEFTSLLVNNCSSKGHASVRGVYAARVASCTIVRGDGFIYVGQGVHPNGVKR